MAMLSSTVVSTDNITEFLLYLKMMEEENNYSDYTDSRIVDEFVSDADYSSDYRCDEHLCDDDEEDY